MLLITTGADLVNHQGVLGLSPGRRRLNTSSFSGKRAFLYRFVYIVARYYLPARENLWRESGFVDKGDCGGRIAPFNLRVLSSLCLQAAVIAKWRHEPSRHET